MKAFINNAHGENIVVVCDSAEEVEKAKIHLAGLFRPQEVKTMEEGQFRGGRHAGKYFVEMWFLYETTLGSRPWTDVA